MADLNKDVLAFSEELNRMCKAYPGCDGCPAYSELLSCGLWHVTPELIDAVQKWSDEHTLKTYAQDFRERFPGCAWCDFDNHPHRMCRKLIYEGMKSCTNSELSCGECWNELMEQGENETD